MDLEEFVGKHFVGVEVRRRKCFAQMAQALIKERSVNLAKLAMHCRYNSTDTEATYRRLERYLASSAISQAQLAHVILHHFDGPLTLALDRTNWQYGSNDINILTLSLVSDDCSLPLFWKLLPHQGNSSVVDRSSLIAEFIDNFGVERIDCLLGDREFIGDEWFKFLDSQGINFHMRIRENIYIGPDSGEMVGANQLINNLKNEESVVLSGKRRIGEGLGRFKGYVAASRSDKGELLVIVSNKNNELALENYKKRWGIETLFGNLKTRGFNFEDTHLTIPERISNLLIVLTFAVFMCYKVGAWISQKAPIPIKKKDIQLFQSFGMALTH